MSKWNSLSHNGPVFPPVYEYKKYSITVCGKKVVLDETAEEIAYLWACKINTDYVKDEVFQNNFWNDFSKVLPDELKKTKFPSDWNFNSIVKDIEAKKEQKNMLMKNVKD